MLVLELLPVVFSSYISYLPYFSQMLHYIVSVVNIGINLKSTCSPILGINLFYCNLNKPYSCIFLFSFRNLTLHNLFKVTKTMKF